MTCSRSSPDEVYIEAINVGIVYFAEERLEMQILVGYYNGTLVYINLYEESDLVVSYLQVIFLKGKRIFQHARCTPGLGEVQYSVESTRSHSVWIVQSFLFCM